MIDSDFLRDPYPVYRALRAQGPLHWSGEFCGGAWLLTQYADVAAALRDPRFSVRRAGGWVNGSGPGAEQALRPFKRLFARSVLFAEGPRHARLRTLMAAGFKPDALQAMAGRIEATVHELLQRALRQAQPAPGAACCATAQFDFMRDFARPLPALVMAGMLGVAAADRDDFVAWSDAIAEFIGAPSPTLEQALGAQAGLLAMSDYFRGVLARRGADDGEDDLLGRLARAAAAGHVRLGAMDLLAQCCTLLFAGHETTRNLLGNGLLALLRHPAAWRRLRQAPQELPAALRELLRYDSPVQYTGRRMKADVPMHGRVLKRGDLVIALIGAANRDPARFHDPDELDIRRDAGAPLSFGHGPHVCLGATLTYLEAEIALRGVLRHWPGLTLDAEAPAWGGNAVYRGLSRLPLRCEFRAQPEGAQQAVSHA